MVLGTRGYAKRAARRAQSQPKRLYPSIALNPHGGRPTNRFGLDRPDRQQDFVPWSWSA